ncbi:cationic amino acid transporter 4-like isoform X1 [Ptychodera flava]|uniref:cationic amino acid transporter 4-like isoform X1 n=1 Tax=Ptychodera flava TaxID=63121 RepID=UPI00396A2785
MAARCCSDQLVSKMGRVKHLPTDITETQLNRCLNVVELIFLGLGSMLGSGLYILTGSLARFTAGPAIIISYLIAGICSGLAALSYAEFGARVPKAGSTYIFVYVTMGELLAFLVGWELILEYSVGAAAISRSWSGYVDTLTGHKISHFILKYITGGPIDVPFIAAYPDFFAFLVVIVVMIIVAIGAKVSAKFYSACTAVNLCIIVFFGIMGCIYGDLDNWKVGGFAPYGFSGIMAAAAPCFYAYVGFDAITTTGEEAKNPTKNIPRALVVTLTVATFCYLTVSASLTLMVPFYDIDPSGALAAAFAYLNIPWAEYITGAGALLGMTSSLMAFMFALPRCIYAMASDGLLCPVFARIHHWTKTPVIATIAFGLLTSVFAIIFDTNALVNFLAIGTLLSYSIVSLSVIVMRYKPAAVGNILVGGDYEKLIDPQDYGKLKKRFRSITILASAEPGRIPAIVTILMALFLFIFSIIAVNCSEAILQKKAWVIILLTLFAAMVAMSLLVICMHQQNMSALNFKVPCVPFVPALSVFFNFILMANLSGVTWIRFGIWVTLGMTVYFTYGMHHSKEGLRQSSEDEVELNETDAILPESAQAFELNLEDNDPTQQSNKLKYGSDDVVSKDTAKGELDQANSANN